MSLRSFVTPGAEMVMELISEPGEGGGGGVEGMKLTRL